VTLLEFLFAVSVVAIAVLGVAGMFPVALRAVMHGGNTTKATLLASSFVEMLRAERFDVLARAHDDAGQPGYDGFDTLQEIAGYACPPPLGASAYAKMRMKCDVTFDGAQGSGRGMPGGRARVAVACVHPDGTPAAGAPCPTDLRRITVTVSWSTGSGTGTSQVTSYAARWE
jgi:hypothetical protein